MTTENNSTYRIDTSEQHDYTTVEAATAEEALDLFASDDASYDSYDRYDEYGTPILRTLWEATTATSESDEDDSSYRMIAIDPDEPDCATGHEHVWETPHDIVGGDPQNPGVRSSGGGVECTSVCVHCGCERTTDSWAQDPVTGQQGLSSIEYLVGKHEVHECEDCSTSLLAARVRDELGDYLCADCFGPAELVYVADAWADLPDSEQTQLLADASEMEQFADGTLSAILSGGHITPDASEKLVELITAWRESGGQDAWYQNVEVPLRAYAKAAE